MVRFTLLCRGGGPGMRMEFRDDDRVGEVGMAVRDVFGDGGFLLRNGYSLLRPDMSVGDAISDGDTVEAIPDPEAYFTTRTRWGPHDQTWLGRRHSPQPAGRRGDDLRVRGRGDGDGARRGPRQ